MMKSIMRKTAMVGGILAIFSVGFMAGSIHTKNSMALEFGGLGQTVESLKSLGSTIVEMEKNVEELQTNINDVKKVRDDLATYQGVYNRVMGTEGTAPAQQKGVSPDLKKGILDMLAPQEQQAPK